MTRFEIIMRLLKTNLASYIFMPPKSGSNKKKNTPRNTKQECYAIRLIQRIARTLNKAAVCFDSGTIVLHDPKHRIYHRLVDDHACGAYPRLGGFTHDAFLSPQKFGAIRRAAAGTARLAELQDARWVVQKEIHSEKLPPLCLRATRDKKIVLFYRFSVNVDGRSHDFLFLKLEEDSYLSVPHVVSAIRYYVFNRRTHADQIGPSRREDDTKTRYDAATERRVIKRNSSGTDTRSALAVLHWYNTHIRVGNELFLPRISWSQRKNI
jgi:hypothetical protein